MVTGDVVNTASRLQTAAPDRTAARRRGDVSRDAQPDRLPAGGAGDRQGQALSRSAWLAVEPSTDPGERPPGPRRSSAAARAGDPARRLGACRRPNAARNSSPSSARRVSARRGSGASSPLVREAGAACCAGDRLRTAGSTAYGAFAHHVKQMAGIFDSDPRRAREKLDAGARRARRGGPSSSPRTSRCSSGSSGDERRRRSRDALLLRARSSRHRRARADGARLRRHPLGGREPARPARDASRRGSRRAAACSLALARPELLSERPVGAAAAGLYRAPARPADDESATSSRRAAGERGRRSAARSPETAEGNPLFIEELAATLAEGTHETDAASDVDSWDRRLRASTRCRRRARSCSTPPSSERSSGAARSSEMGRERGRALEAIDSLEGRDLIRREAVIANPGRPAVRLQAWPDPRRRVCHAAACGTARATRDSRAFLEETRPRVGQSREARRAALARGRRARARGRHSFSPGTRPARLGEGARPSRSTARRSSSSPRRTTRRRRDIGRTLAVALQAPCVTSPTRGACVRESLHLSRFRGV